MGRKTKGLTSWITHNFQFFSFPYFHFSMKQIKFYFYAGKIIFHYQAFVVCGMVVLTSFLGWWRGITLFVLRKSKSKLLLVGKGKTMQFLRFNFIPIVFGRTANFLTLSPLSFILFFHATSNSTSNSLLHTNPPQYLGRRAEKKIVFEHCILLVRCL